MNAHSEFSKLGLGEKIQCLYEHGTFVADIRYYQYKVNLYLLEGEYYEVFVDQKSVMITGIDALDFNSSRFDFFLDQIQIEDIA